MGQKQTLIGGAVVVLAFAAFGYWYFLVQKRPMGVITAPPPVATTTDASLGTAIYEQSKNPIHNKVPEAKNPAVNPIEGIYKNPF